MTFPAFSFYGLIFYNVSVTVIQIMVIPDYFPTISDW